MAAKFARLTRLDPRKTVFLLCDIQEAFRNAMPLINNLIKNTTTLLKAGKEFEVPLLVSEQYPEKLGKTVKELDIGHACLVQSKTWFSMVVPQLEAKMHEIYSGNPSDAVLFGLESHVCVEQTAMDLIDRCINVMIVADCCCSRLNQDRDMAMERLRQIGCIVTTSESVIFNLLQDKNHPKFNVIRKLVAETAAYMELAKVGPK